MTRLCAKPNRQLQLVQSPCYQEGRADVGNAVLLMNLDLRHNTKVVY